MSYFDSVYKKRLNRFGTNIQQRVQNKKEYDFGTFLKKSPNRITINYQTDKFYGVVEDKKVSEVEVIDYLLTCKTLPLNKGSVFSITDVKDTISYWISLGIEELTLCGYNKQVITKLDTTLEWVDNGYLYNEKCHFVRQRDASLIKRTAAKPYEAYITLPSSQALLIIPSTTHLKRESRLKFADEAWKVVEIDKMSVPNVYYVSIEKTYIDKIDDAVYPNGDLLTNWKISSNYGDTIELPVGGSLVVNFSVYYGDELKDVPLNITSNDSTIVTYSTQLDGIKLGSTTLTVKVIGNEIITKDFVVNVVSIPVMSPYITGADSLKVSSSSNCIFNNPDNLTGLTYTSLKNLFSIVQSTNTEFTITGEEIGEDTLQVMQDTTLIYSKPIKIKSFWLEV